MRIEFTSRRHAVAAARVAFEAHVDDRPVWCSVSLDALNDRFGNTGTSAHALLSWQHATHWRKTGVSRWSWKRAISNDPLRPIAAPRCMRRDSRGHRTIPALLAMRIANRRRRRVFRRRGVHDGRLP